MAAIAAQFQENPAEVPQGIDTVCSLIDYLDVLVRDDLICITKDGSRLRCSLNREALENMMDDLRRLLL